MTTPDGVRAGTLYADVEGDTRGFGRDLQAKIDAATANVRARIQAEVDSRKLQAQLDASVRATKATITVPVTVDSKRLATDLKAAIATAQARAGKITLDVDADTAAATAKIDEAARDRTSTIEVDADTAKAEAEIDAAARDRKTTVSANFDGSKLLSASAGILQLMKFPAIAQGIGLAVAAVAQLGAGLIAMTSAAAPAVGLLGLIPAAGAALVTGLAPVVTSFMGIGTAVKAMDAQQKTATSSGATLAAAQQAAAQRIVAAKRSVVDATRQQTETEITGAEAVQSAEQALGNAQQQAVIAQQTLTQARITAKQALEDYTNQLADANLNERGAKLAIEQAKQTLDATNHSATSTALQRKQAKLAYDEAVQRLKDIEVQNKRLEDSARKARDAGVKGDAGVVAARRGVASANQNVANQEQSLADARRQQFNANRSAAEQVQTATESLTQAIQAQRAEQDKTTAASNAEAVAMANLSPAGRKFATFLHDTLMPNLRTLRASAQTAFLPPLQDGLEAAQRLLPNLNRLLSKSGAVMGDVADKALHMVSSGPWRRDFDTITDQSTKTVGALGKALNPILRIVRDLTVAGGPFVTHFANNIAKGARHLSDFINTQRRIGEADPNKGLSGFFRNAERAGARLWDILKNLGGALYNIGRDAAPAGRILLKSLDDSLAHLRAITNPDTKGGKGLKQYFLDAVPGVKAAGRLIDSIVVGIGKIGHNKGVASLLDQIRTQLVPALTSMFQQIQSGFGPAFVHLITNLVHLFGDLGGGGGGLTAAAKALGLVAGALDAIVKIPGVGPVIRGLLGIGGAAVGIGLVSGGLLKMGSRLAGVVDNTRKLAQKLGPAISKAADLGGKMAYVGKQAAIAGVEIAKAGAKAAIAAGKWLLLKVQAAASAAAEIAAGAAAKIAAAGEWLLNAALDANPFVLIGILIAALVVAIIELWKHSETFRKIVTAAFHDVLKAVQWVWNWVKKNWPYLLGMLAGPFGLAVVAIAKHWDKIKSMFTAAFGWVKDKWRAFWGDIKDIGNSIFGATGDALHGILGGLKTAFQHAVDGIKAVWRTLKEIVKAPVSFIVNTVYNKGIRWAWNKVAGLVHLPDLPEAHFADGGVLPGYAPGRDSVHVMASPGEGWLTPEATRSLGGERGITAINRALTPRLGGSSSPPSEGTQRFSFGGIVHSVTGALGGAGRGFLHGVGWVGSKALGLIRQAAADAISGLLGPIRSELGSLTDGTPWAGALVGMFNSLIDSVINKIKGASTPTETHHTGGVVGGGGGEQVIRALTGEGILTPQATSALGGAPGIAAMNRSPLAAVMASARAAGASAPITYTDRSVTFEDGAIQITNPEPEPASDTINTRMRRLAALGVFGNG